ncbi:hypothetical protein [Nitratidesulfovibrio sp.]|uniref:hypothetical protein n=1 Tax=Nitratidesulfovibrio sp. TaxID=2802297 RepID=UPI00333E9A95
MMKTGKRAFVLASPLYEREMPKLPRADEEHVIPSRYRRIIAVPVPQRTKDSHCMTGTFAPYEQPVTGIWQPALRSKAHTPSPPPTALAF